MKILFAALLMSNAFSMNMHVTECGTVLQTIPNYALEEDSACGVACLRSVMDYMSGIKISEYQLSLQTGADGWNQPPEGLRHALFVHKLFSKWEKDSTLAAIRRYMLLGESIIVNTTRDGQFLQVVIKKVGPEGVIVMDPKEARFGKDRHLTFPEFDREWRVLVGQTWERGDILRVSRVPIR